MTFLARGDVALSVAVTSVTTPLAAVPSAIFSVWHNISGPLAATLYQRFRSEEQPAAVPASIKS